MDWALGWPWVVFTKTPYKRVVGTIAAAAIAVGGLGYGVSKIPTGGGGEVANLWIDTDGGTCTRTAGGGAVYSSAAACSSIQTSLAACTAGDTIRMVAGSYAAQSITDTNTTPGCTVDGEGEAGQVFMGAIDTSGSWFTLKDLTVNVGANHNYGGISSNGGSNIVLDNVDAHGDYVSVLINPGTSNLTWKNSELGEEGVMGGKRTCVGSNDDAEPVEIKGSSGNSVTDVLLERITIHPQDHDPAGDGGCSTGFHLEMIRIDRYVDGFTLKNSYIDDGHHANSATIFISDIDDITASFPRDLNFLNNYIGLGDSPSFTIHPQVDDCIDCRWAYNTFKNWTNTFRGGEVVGNLGPRTALIGCYGTFTKNVWQGTSNPGCGTDTWVSGTADSTSNLGIDSTGHLTVGSPAIDAAETAGFCTSTLGSVDQEGGTRPVSTACDAGSDEYGSP